MPTDQISRMRDYVDWAVRGAVAALMSAAVAVAMWGFDTEARVDSVEKFDPRITALEAKDDGYQKLATDIAVVQARLEAQNKQLDRIEALLAR